MQKLHDLRTLSRDQKHISSCWGRHYWATTFPNRSCSKWNITFVGIYCNKFWYPLRMHDAWTMRYRAPGGANPSLGSVLSCLFSNCPNQRPPTFLQMAVMKIFFSICPLFLCRHFYFLSVSSVSTFSVGPTLHKVNSFSSFPYSSAVILVFVTTLALSIGPQINLSPNHTFVIPRTSWRRHWQELYSRNMNLNKSGFWKLSDGVSSHSLNISQCHWQQLFHWVNKLCTYNIHNNTGILERKEESPLPSFHFFIPLMSMSTPSKSPLLLVNNICHWYHHPIPDLLDNGLLTCSSWRF